MRERERIYIYIYIIVKDGKVEKTKGEKLKNVTKKERLCVCV